MCYLDLPYLRALIWIQLLSRRLQWMFWLKTWHKRRRYKTNWSAESLWTRVWHLKSRMDVLLLCFSMFLGFFLYWSSWPYLAFTGWKLFHLWNSTMVQWSRKCHQSLRRHSGVEKIGEISLLSADPFDGKKSISSVFINVRNLSSCQHSSAGFLPECIRATDIGSPIRLKQMQIFQ